MQIIHHLSIDLARQLPMTPIGAVQGDANTRAVEISLLENGEPWKMPEGITAAVAFRKPDKTRGLYDTLPDKTKAVTITGSTVTAILAPQVLSCAGEVSAAVVFHDSKLNQLATFPFAIRVEANPAAGQQVSNDYYQYSTMEEVSAAVEAALAALEDSKQDFLARAEKALQVVHDTATEDAPAIICEASGAVITAEDAANRPLSGLSIYGKTVQDGTPSPENPAALVSVGAAGAIKTTVGGKNLCNPNDFITPEGNKFYAVSDDGYILFNNTSGVAQYPKCTYNLPKGTYAVTVEVESGSSAELYISNRANDYSSWRITQTATKVFDDIDYLWLMVALSTAKQQKVRITINSGSTALLYEPYKGQTLTASTPGGLPGIPVESGGNYTDENGQQWICDEIDFGRGVLVQSVRKLASYAGESITGAYISTTGELTAGATVLYALENPTEFPLSAGELAAYAALHSNKPHTTVFNDSGAGMKLSYAADTKTYIDNKLAAISAAILS